MNEFQKLGMEKDPPSSIDGVQMTRSEYSKFRELADPTGFVEQAAETETYKTANEKRKRLFLGMVREHFYEQAAEKVKTEDTFKDLRSRIRNRLAENRRAVGAEGMPPHIQESPDGSPAPNGEI